MGKAKRAKSRANLAAKAARRAGEDAPFTYEDARRDVDEMIAAGELDPANVYDDGKTIRIVSDMEFSPGFLDSIGTGKGSSFDRS